MIAALVVILTVSLGIALGTMNRPQQSQRQPSSRQDAGAADSDLADAPPPPAATQSAVQPTASSISDIDEPVDDAHLQPPPVALGRQLPPPPTPSMPSGAPVGAAVLSGIQPDQTQRANTSHVISEMNCLHCCKRSTSSVWHSSCMHAHDELCKHLSFFTALVVRLTPNFACR
jgi:hypothetical protein